MRIWLFNHYAVPPKYYPLARTSTFARYLQKAGHDVRIFAASSIHNSAGKNLIEGGKPYLSVVEEVLHGFTGKRREFSPMLMLVDTSFHRLVIFSFLLNCIRKDTCIAKSFLSPTTHA